MLNYKHIKENAMFDYSKIPDIALEDIATDVNKKIVILVIYKNIVISYGKVGFKCAQRNGAKRYCSFAVSFSAGYQRVLLFPCRHTYTV